MAFDAGAAIDVFDGSSEVTSSSSSVADGAMSVAGDVAAWTNTLDAPTAIFIFKGTYTVAPSDYSTVLLMARLLNVEGTDDDEAPVADTFEHQLLRAFPLKAVTSEQIITRQVRLPSGKSGQEFEFYIRNKAGQTLSASWQLFINPSSFGSST